MVENTTIPGLLERVRPRTNSPFYYLQILTTDTNGITELPFVFKQLKSKIYENTIISTIPNKNRHCHLIHFQISMLLSWLTVCELTQIGAGISRVLPPFCPSLENASVAGTGLITLMKV